MTIWIGNYWKKSEVACHCGCGRDEIHPALIELADDVRRSVGHSMECLSGLRCEERNTIAKGRPNSLHLPAGALHQGHAGDFTFMDHRHRTPINILRLYVLFESFGRRHGALGLGLYSWGVHVDVRGEGLGLRPGRWDDSSWTWPRLT